LFRTLRLTRARFDAVYQDAAAAPQDWLSFYSREWFELLAGHASNGGAVFVDVPLAGLNPPALAVVSRTFERAMGARAACQLAYPRGRAVLRLAGRPHSDFFLNVPEQGSWAPVSCLKPQDYRPDTHTLRRDRLTQALTLGPAPVHSLVAWLQTCHSQTLALDP
jgi:hypothetical protein